VFGGAGAARLIDRHDCYADRPSRLVEGSRPSHAQLPAGSSDGPVISRSTSQMTTIHYPLPSTRLKYLQFRSVIIFGPRKYIHPIHRDPICPSCRQPYDITDDDHPLAASTRIRLSHAPFQQPTIPSVGAARSTHGSRTGPKGP
jgi:hypothetical protein